MTERPLLHLALLCAFLMPLSLSAGCSCGGTDEPAAPCLTDSDCGAGGTCTDGMCRPSSPAPDAELMPDAPPAGPRCESAIFCGMPPECCESGTECIEGACVPVCPSGVRCASACCGDTQVCVSDACVSPGGPCGDSFDCPMGEFCEPTLNRCLPQFDPVECIVPPVLGAFETTAELSLTTSTRRPDCLHCVSTLARLVCNRHHRQFFRFSTRLRI